MTKIPIENIYYIALYAWNKINNKDFISRVGMEDINRVNDVVVELFLSEVSKICKKGLYGEYIDDDFESEYLKGKINIRQSIYLIDPKMSCRYDEFTRNNNLNQVLKAILNMLYFMKNLNKNFKKRSRSLLLEFQEVENISLNERYFKLVNYNRMNQDYKFPIELGYLIYRNSIPTEDRNINEFIEVDRDEERMSSIFEEFIKNFYKIHTNYKITSRRYSWDLIPLGNSHIDFIPSMETDIEIERPREKIIIDAKYYRNAFISRFDNEKFISNHMYQISAYLRKNINMDEKRDLRGILIYPSNGYDFYERFRSKEGYTIEFKTVNLKNKWYNIERDLLSIL